MRSLPIAVVTISTVLAVGVASASTDQLWAINVGDFWSMQDSSYSLSFNPFDSVEMPYSYTEMTVLEDAAFDAASSKLYVSGWQNDESPPWYGWNRRSSSVTCPAMIHYR